MQGDLFPAPVHLRSVDPARNRHRFYSLRVLPDLFGEWVLVREWGRIGTSGQARTELHSSLLEADAAMRAVIEQKRGRGYG